MLKDGAQPGRLYDYDGSLSSPAPQTLGLPGFVVACLLGAALFASLGTLVWWVGHHLRWT